MKLSKLYHQIVGLLLLLNAIPSLALASLPSIQSRDSWATPEDNLYTLNTWPPNPGNTFLVKRILLHDTGLADFNNDSLDPRQVIKSIFNIQAKNNAWGDIGYNYLIARDGSIYQGRMGQNGVRGAHLYVNRTGDNFNYQSIGIGLLGRYGSGFAPVPTPMKESLAQLIGWLSSSNSLNPESYTTQPVWNFYTQGYTGTYTGYNLSDHGEIEAGNGDTNMVDMTWLRARSRQWKEYYDQSVYKDYNERFYTIQNGLKRITSDLAGKNVLSISQSQLELFPDNYKLRTFPNGSLLRNSRGVGYLEDGFIRPIVNPQVFDSRFKWKDVLDISQAEWESYPISKALSLREGMLVREANNPDVYIISNQTRRHIPSPAIFEALGYKWSNITVLPAGTLAITHPRGSELQTKPYPDGTLLVNQDNPTGIEVLENGKRRPIPSPEIFDTQYNYKDLVFISGAEWNTYAQGAPVYFWDGAVLRANGANEIYVISDGQKRYVTSPQVFLGLGYKWSNVLVVSRAGLDSIPTGPSIDQTMLD